MSNDTVEGAETPAPTETPTTPPQEAPAGDTGGGAEQPSS